MKRALRHVLGGAGPAMELSGVHARAVDTPLTQRAVELLASGPAGAAAIVEYVCNLASAPVLVAERMASAMFAGRPEFMLGEDGRWRLATRLGSDSPTSTYVAGSTISSGSTELSVPDHLDSLTFAVVDVETTGTQPHFGDRITEVAVVIVRDGAVTDRFDTLVNPCRPIPAFITRLTNITSEMVKDAPTFDQIAPRLLATITGHVFTAHNATFDWRFVSAELGRASGLRLAGRRLCTVRLARRLLPQLPRRTLDYVARYYGVSIDGRHRAGGDAVATAECFLRMLADARDRGCQTWDDLQALTRGPRIKRRRRRAASPSPVSRDTTA